MKTAIKHVQSFTIDFLTRIFNRITDYREANELLIHLSGIITFFRNQQEFLTFLELLHSRFMICENSDRREYGDFQTPSILTNSICLYLACEGKSPDILIEPTFGKGSFILSAIKHFPRLKKIYGIEIFESYYWQTKFAILELFVKNPNLSKPRIFLYLDNIFKFNFKAIKKSIGNCNLLVLGNPPWVTNSELGSLSSVNLPKKSNFKSFNGLEAMTGKGNFDIGEHIVLMMLNSFSEYNGYLAFLLKNSIIKNLVYDLPKSNYNINDLVALKIDTKKFFNASVEASLFKCSFKPNNYSFICKASSLVSPVSIENEFGWIDNKFVSCIPIYKKNTSYDGVSPYIWRQGVKHDCSKIMELDLVDNKYVNGFNEKLNLEKDLIYGLLKSSDLNSLVIMKPRKYIIITQKKIGEDTINLSDKFPKLYQYLAENVHFFEKRKSIIYKNKAPFSIFGIGDYSFKPYKVAISGLYKRSTFSLILHEDNKPLMLDDTCYFLSFENLPEAVFVWSILNGKSVQQLLTAIVFLDAKRPYTKDILMRISIDKIVADMTYEEIINQIEHLDKGMLVNVSEDKWNAFIGKINKLDMEGKQLSLFELTTSQPLPPFSSTRRLLQHSK